MSGLGLVALASKRRKSMSEPHAVEVYRASQAYRLTVHRDGCREIGQRGYRAPLHESRDARSLGRAFDPSIPSFRHDGDEDRRRVLCASAFPPTDLAIDRSCPAAQASASAHCVLPQTPHHKQQKKNTTTTSKTTSRKL